MMAMVETWCDTSGGWSLTLTPDSAWSVMAQVSWLAWLLTVYLGIRSSLAPLSKILCITTDNESLSPALSAQATTRYLHSLDYSHPAMPTTTTLPYKVMFRNPLDIMLCSATTFELVGAWGVILYF